MKKQDKGMTMPQIFSESAECMVASLAVHCPDAYKVCKTADKAYKKAVHELDKLEATDFTLALALLAQLFTSDVESAAAFIEGEMVKDMMEDVFRGLRFEGEE